MGWSRLRIRRPITSCDPQHRCSDAPEILCTWLLHTDEPFIFYEPSDMQPWQLAFVNSLRSSQGAGPAVGRRHTPDINLMLATVRIFCTTPDRDFILTFHT